MKNHDVVERELAVRELSGSTADPSVAPVLLEVPSHQDVVRQAAEWAIEEISRGK